MIHFSFFFFSSKSPSPPLRKGKIEKGLFKGEQKEIKEKT
jgi:hypothetical protein